MASWNLTDFYSSIEDNKIINDLVVLSSKINKFVTEYKVAPEKISAEDLRIATEKYEDIIQLIGTLSSYAFLIYATNLQEVQNIKFYNKINEQLNNLSSKLTFFPLIITRLPQEIVLGDHVRLKHYKPWYCKIRKYTEYYLPENLEQFLIEKNTSQQYWIQLFDSVIANIRIQPPAIHSSDQALLNLEQALHLLLSPDANIRKDIAQKVSNVLSEQKLIFTTIYNALIKDKNITDKWRKLPSPQMDQHLNNEIEAVMVENLVQITKHNYTTIAGRYYKIKAKLLGLEQLYFWDRNAPIITDKKLKVAWEFEYSQAQKLVLEAYREFSPFMAEIAQMFFDKNWIDAEPRLGKMGGGFAHPTVPNVHPYILLNYLKSSRDVMTLAHEIGHGIHQYLAASQGMLIADTPLVIAEIASIFGEMLTFKKLLDTASVEHKIILLTNKIEDKINTVIRQIAFYEFECKIHAMCQNQTLSYDEICDVWMTTQAESFGNSLVLTENYRPLWCYVSHFIHQPFYVYAYAFSDCLVNNLYSSYQGAQTSRFVEKYIEILAQGRRLSPQEAMMKFDIDLTTTSCWEQGLHFIEDLINQLEAII